MGANAAPACRRPAVASAMARHTEGPPVYSGEKARGGEIILRTGRERAIFIAGLAGAIILAVLLAWVIW